MLTLAVSDLERSLAFYRDGLGPSDPRGHRAGVRGRRRRLLSLERRSHPGAVSGHLARQGRADPGHPDAARGPWRSGMWPARRRRSTRSWLRPCARVRSSPTRRGSLLGRLLRPLPRPGRASLGNRLEPAMAGAGLSEKRRGRRRASQPTTEHSRSRRGQTFVLPPSAGRRSKHQRRRPQS